MDRVRDLKHVNKGQDPRETPNTFISVRARSRLKSGVEAACAQIGPLIHHRQRLQCRKFELRQEVLIKDCDIPVVRPTRADKSGTARGRLEEL